MIIYSMSNISIKIFTNHYITHVFERPHYVENLESHLKSENCRES